MNKNNVFSVFGLPVSRPPGRGGMPQVASGVDIPMNKDTYVNKSVTDEPGVSIPALGESAIGVEAGERARKLYEAMRRSHASYCDAACFTRRDVEELLEAYEHGDAEKIERIKERFANLSWEHFFQEFLEHYYSEEVSGK